ncbi:MAG: RagB/SusD family nutrient uptake outer membrane protein [Bacteroidota bacterium]
MKHQKNIIAAIALILAIAGCKKYEQFPVDKVGIDKIFDPRDSAGSNAQKYLYGIYSVLKSGHNRVAGDYLDAASDDAISSASGPTNNVTILSTGSYNSYSLPNDENVFGQYYAGIRQANEFVSNIDVVPTIGKYKGIPLKTIWKSEARFLRAYFYFELLKRYGGIPLVGDKVYTITDDISLPRNSFEDCVKYIVSECDAIKGTLITYPFLKPDADPDADSHRVTQGAAMALKARVLLYAASPLFNGGNIEPSNSLTGYTDFQASRWTAAAAAAKEVVNLNTYSLLPEFKDVFLTQNNLEILFMRNGDNSNSVESANGPVGFTSANGRGQTSPTQELVNAFPMANGLPIADAASGYDVNKPYANRDPRLAKTILYNGAAWLNSELQTYEGGQSKPNGSLQQTKTSYYMRKFMGNFENTNAYSSHSTDWLIMRYSDLLLGYAEALNESEGPTTNVYNTLISIRKRAGINAGSDNLYGLKAGITKEDMRTVIQNERRVELAFEESRYWDIRRWKLAENNMNQPRTGLSIVKVGTIFNYNPVNVLASKFVAPKMYLYPIPYDEVQKNPNMKQNPGW